MNPAPAPVLVAEDNQDDFFLLQRAFIKSEITSSLQWARNGAEAREYLERSMAEPAIHPVPFLVLADVKMPFMDGLELLCWVKAQPAFKRIPFVILSSSNQVADINNAYEMGANSYLVKPGSFQDLLKLSLCIKTYWFTLNALPGGCSSPSSGISPS